MICVTVIPVGPLVTVTPLSDRQVDVTPLQCNGALATTSLVVQETGSTVNVSFVGDAVTSVGDTFTGEAGVALGGLRAVAVHLDSKVYYADPAAFNEARICGMTTGAAAMGAPATIRVGGVITEASWNWLEGPVYSGANGVLTQVEPTGAAILQRGIALGPKALRIAPEHIVDLL